MRSITAETNRIQAKVNTSTYRSANYKQTCLSCYCICFSENDEKNSKRIPVTHRRGVYDCDFTLRHRRRRRSLGINTNHQANF